MPTFLVGGAVRDQLLGQPVTDRDWVVVGATPEAMISAGYIPVGRDFPVFLHPQTHEEYALARTERKSGRGYHGFVFHTGHDVTLEADLARRDLTINAMARDDNGTLIDPHHGRRDLEARLLRHVSDAFGEDPVRLLRLARYYTRFAPLGFEVADDTMTLARTMVANGEIEHLVPERVWEEMQRAMLEPQPRHFFQLLRDCGALGVILPELDALFGVPQPARYHPEIDAGIHTLLTLQQTANAGANLTVRYAALCHDLGKASTPSHILPAHHGHEQRGVAPTDAASQRLGVPKRLRQTARLITRWHTHLHRLHELRPATVVKLLEGMDAFRRPERLADLIATCIADARGRTGLENTPYPQAELIRSARDAAAAISGADMAARGLKGPQIGEAMRRERIAAIRRTLTDS